MATVGTVEDLRTIEDFQRKALDLLDGAAQAWKYAVKSFGYCRKCRAVTQYTGDYGLEGCWTTCLKCEKVFGGGHGMAMGLDSELYTTTIEEMPEDARHEILRLQSREVQTQFLLEALEKFIAQRKKDLRKLQGSVRALRALEKRVKSARESAQ